MMNKQLSLLRAQSVNTNTSFPLENVTNLAAVANVLIVNVNKCRIGRPVEK
jgi:hypothetical protein